MAERDWALWFELYTSHIGLTLGTRCHLMKKKSAGHCKLMENRYFSDSFTAGDLCFAGETWQEIKIPNEPKQPETWIALTRLCSEILEPVREQFGRPEITYGFASAALLKAIPRHIAPALDQHASCELNSRGNLICKRMGAAIDFHVPGLSSAKLFIWILENLPYDRLYFYSDNRPVHVSYGPEQAKSIVSMLLSKSGRRVPRKIDVDWLKRNGANTFG